MFNFKNTKIGSLLEKLKQRIIIETDALWNFHTGSRLVKHPAKRSTVHSDWLNRKTNDSKRKLIHNHQNPMSF